MNTPITHGLRERDGERALSSRVAQTRKKLKLKLSADREQTPSDDTHCLLHYHLTAHSCTSRASDSARKRTLRGAALARNEQVGLIGLRHKPHVGISSVAQNCVCAQVFRQD